jgi:DNA uptake protein ComE-like DNA-binding protein
MHQAKAQIIRTFQLLIVATLAATIWLRPAAEAREARHGFLAMWWSEHPALRVNQLDSNAIFTLPLPEAAKKSWWYRCKKSWTIKDLLALKSLSGMDTLFVITGNFDFTPIPPQQKEQWGSSSWQNPKLIPWDEPKSEHVTNNRVKRLDLNEVDSAALVAVRGIGPWSAHAIIEERSRWGYFSTVSQLRKIRSLDARWKKEWDSVFYVVSRAPKLCLNTSSFIDLNNFYGFRFHQVKRIVFYRERFGPVLRKELVLWEEFSDVDTTFLRHYVSE